MINSAFSKEKVEDILSGRSVLILGFGREGRSSYNFLRKYFPEKKIGIADQNANLRNDDLLKNDAHLQLHLGENYLESAVEYDLILKTPGISNKLLPIEIPSENISGQTDLFLQLCGKQCIGITGTKGKSTTTYLTYHIIKKQTDNVILCGNMGIPLFDKIEEIDPQTIIVCEFSSHQLQNIRSAPHIAVLLNLYQEHLDHYNSYKEYQLAKYNIAKYQSENDYFIYNSDNALINELLNETSIKSQKIGFSLTQNIENDYFIDDDYICLKLRGNIEKIYPIHSPRFLQGSHNLLNIMAAIVSCKLSGISNKKIGEGLSDFKGLEHRLEYVGNVKDILFYNDSISTIPEATIAAIKTLENVDTLILGGFDRGIDYSELTVFLRSSNIRNFVFVGNAGKRILAEMKNEMPIKQKYLTEIDYSKIVDWCFENTKKKSICLLSPAAASYDSFKNFEERGRIFKGYVSNKISHESSSQTQ